jgi:hypothetical protein
MPHFIGTSRLHPLVAVSRIVRYGLRPVRADTRLFAIGGCVIFAELGSQWAEPRTVGDGLSRLHQG